MTARKAEPRCTRGGQPRYSALAITTALTLRAVFRLALRQTEGLMHPFFGCLVLISQHPTIRRSADGARHCRCRDREPAAKRSTCWWTAQGSSFAVPVSGWSRKHAAKVTLLHGSIVRPRGLEGISGPHFLTLGRHRAIQSEPRSPSSHPEAAAQSDELGCL